MRALRNIPIRRKLTLIIMLVSGASLLMACAAFLSYEHMTSRGTMVDDLTSTAKMIGENSSAALSFSDPDAAEQTLKSLNVHSHVVSAAIFDRDGNLFAHYLSPGLKDGTIPKSPEWVGHRFGRNRLELYQEIVLAGESIGLVYIHSDLSEVYERLWRYSMIVFIVILAASLLGYVLSTYMQKVISEPVTHLLKIIGAVAKDQNYSIRAVKQSQDELGGLIDGFNGMLAQIQKRDEELKVAQETLERRVEERTSELQQEVIERQRSEEALRESNQRFEIVTQATTDVIWDWDLASNKILWNKHFQSVFGYPSKDVVPDAAGWASKIHVDDRTKVFQSVREVIDGGGHLWSGEYRFLRYDGEYAFVFDRGYVLHDEQGRPIRMIGAMQDVTERKQAEEELERVHRQLLDSSRQAGMAEVATGVLHNVGNVLNSVNVSATLAAETMRKSKLGNLAKVVALMDEHQSDLGGFMSRTAKGQQVPVYLKQLAGHLQGEHGNLLEELESIRKNVEHIKEIVSMQQSYAKVSGVKEVVDVAGIVEDAIRLNAGALERHRVNLVREFEDLPPVNLDKHKVLQILVNLIRNAKYACDESDHPEKRLTLRVKSRDASVEITVADNGVGISPENLTRIFSHGFTTRKEGHGFGLHSGALAAKEMGGSLTVHSDGPGRGATFVLTLPLEQASAEQQSNSRSKTSFRKPAHA